MFFHLTDPPYFPIPNNGMPDFRHNAHAAGASGPLTGISAIQQVRFPACARSHNRWWHVWHLRWFPCFRMARVHFHPRPGPRDKRPLTKPNLIVSVSSDAATPCDGGPVDFAVPSRDGTIDVRNAAIDLVRAHDQDARGILVQACTKARLFMQLRTSAHRRERVNMRSDWPRPPLHGQSGAACFKQ